MLSFSYHLYETKTAAYTTGILTTDIKTEDFAKLIAGLKYNAVSIDMIANSKESLQKAIDLLTVLKDTIK